MRERILLIRRDNIGDLVLTTPLIAALRSHKPDAWIGFLANSYNAAVLAGNPHLDAVYAYDKAKHFPERSRLSVYWDTAKLLLRLRALRIDTVVLAGPGAQRQAYGLTRWIGPQRVVGFVTSEFSPDGITVPVQWTATDDQSETEDIFRLLTPFGIRGAIPPCELFPDPTAVAQAMNGAERRLGRARRPWIGIQISARRPKQRWPVERFASLMQAMHARAGGCFMLFWAPGSSDDARHPGDDEAAQALADLLPAGFPLYPCATSSLPDLIAGLSLVDGVITPDGGAMHIAAGLHKPIVALFGDSPPERWRPWGVEHECIQVPERDVKYITVDLVVAAWERLMQKLQTAAVS